MKPKIDRFCIDYRCLGLKDRNGDEIGPEVMFFRGLVGNGYRNVSPASLFRLSHYANLHNKGGAILSHCWGWDWEKLNIVGGHS